MKTALALRFFECTDEIIVITAYTVWFTLLHMHDGDDEVISSAHMCNGACVCVCVFALLKTLGALFGIDRTLMCV